MLEPTLSAAASPTHTRARRWSRIAGPALLLLVTVGFYWKLVLSSQYIWFDHPDMCYIELPRLQFQAAEIHKRHFPLWDPNIWCGQPLVGQTQPGPVFPLNLLFYLLPLRDGYLNVDYLNAYYVAIHFLAAFFCYLLCRDLGLGLRAAMLAGAAFAFGGFVGTAPWLDVFNGAIWTPLVLLYFLRAARGERPAASAALSGLWLGVAWLSGHHEIPILVSCAAIVAWAALCWRKRSLLPYAILSFVIAGLVSAMQVWPTYEFGRLSQRWVGAESPAAWQDRIPYTIHTIYSAPAKALWETALPSAATYADTSPFLGIVVVALAALGLVSWWKDARVRGLAVLAMLSALYAMGAFSPLHGVMYALSPALAKARIPVRAFHLYDFALAVLAAFGMTALWTKKSAAWTRRVAIATAVFGILIGATGIVLTTAGRDLDDRLWLASLSACGAAIVFWLRQRDNLAPNLCYIALLTLMLTELTNLNPRTFAHLSEGKQLKFAGTLFRDRDVADFLRGQPGPVRVHVNEQDGPLNFGDWHGIEMYEGYVAGVPVDLARHELHTKRTQDLFAVTHYVGKNQDRPDQVALFEGASGVKVFRNPDAGPRAWSVHETVAAADWNQINALLRDPAFDYHKTAAVAPGAPPLEQCADGDEVRITRHGADHVTIAATMACRGMVVLAESFYPGWRLKIDGKPAQILPAYGALRGIVVERGSHTVDMIYRPLSNLGGAALSLIGLIATCGIVLRSRARSAS